MENSHVLLRRGWYRHSRAPRFLCVANRVAGARVKIDFGKVEKVIDEVIVVVMVLALGIAASILVHAWLS